MDNEFFDALFGFIAFFSIIAFIGSQGALCAMAPEQWYIGFVSFIGLVASGWFFFRRD